MQTFELCVNMLSEELSYPFIKPVKQGALITNSKLVFDFLLNLRFLDACYARLNKREYINFYDYQLNEMSLNFVYYMIKEIFGNIFHNSIF